MNNQFLFDFEVLRCRLLIRDFFLSYSTTEIYENIGQVLSLVNLQLENINPGDPSQLQLNHDLIEAAIRDLRKMSSSFFPEQVMDNKDGFERMLYDAVQILYPEQTIILNVLFNDARLWHKARIVIFSFILEALSFLSSRLVSCDAILLRFQAGIIEIVLERVVVPVGTLNQVMSDLAFYGGFSNALLLMNGEFGMNSYAYGTSLEFILKPDFDE
jgi:hypothetical protein